MDQRTRRKGAYGLFLLLAAVVAAPAQTFTKLVDFNGTNGAYPQYGALIQGTDGNIWGATLAGEPGLGTIFKITPGGSLTTVYSFTSPYGTYPYGGLTQATDGNLYGTTMQGGIDGGGTVFKITPEGTLTDLYSFDETTGAFNPNGLVQGADGALSGTTVWGASDGTIFRITLDGTLTTLYGWTDAIDPYPGAGLLQATDGNFYGTTMDGGMSTACAFGCGTIFRLTPAGTLTTMHSFSLTDGAFPQAGVIEGTDGNFYGTTAQGGASGDGTIFRITPSGTLTTLYAFSGNACACVGLVQATDGNFYGTTSAHSVSEGYGTIFKITPGGTLTTLHRLRSTDGIGPFQALVQGTDGTFYGTTVQGGAYGQGTVFSLSAGLGPFVKALPHAGKVGSAVKILGTNLTSATSVWFGGTPAAFAVVSATEISTTVPPGATTGRVQVTTPGGTLSSGGPFLVFPLH